jgi:hypothetical protein
VVLVQSLWISTVVGIDALGAGAALAAFACGAAVVSTALADDGSPAPAPAPAAAGEPGCWGIIGIMQWTRGMATRAITVT